MIKFLYLLLSSAVTAFKHFLFWIWRTLLFGRNWESYEFYGGKDKKSNLVSLQIDLMLEQLLGYGWSVTV